VVLLLAAEFLMALACVLPLAQAVDSTSRVPGAPVLKPTANPGT